MRIDKQTASVPYIVTEPDDRPCRSAYKKRIKQEQAAAKAAAKVPESVDAVFASLFVTV